MWTHVPSSELLFGQERTEIVQTDIRVLSKPSSSREAEMISALGMSRRHSLQDRMGDHFFEKKWQGRYD